jgi:hypothetical protein
MALRSATQIGLGRDDDRWSPGFIIAADTVLYGGEVVTQDPTDASGKTIKVFGGVIVPGVLTTSFPFPIGLVYENTNAFTPGGASGDRAAGRGFDSLDYARGSNYSVFHRPGNVIDVFNDYRNTVLVNRAKNGGGTSSQSTSCPFIASDNFAIGDLLYATVDGLLTNTSPGAGTVVILGHVRAASGTGEDQVISVEWMPGVGE